MVDKIRKYLLVLKKDGKYYVVFEKADDGVTALVQGHVSVWDITRDMGAMVHEVLSKKKDLSNAETISDMFDVEDVLILEKPDNLEDYILPGIRIIQLINVDLLRVGVPTQPVHESILEWDTGVDLFMELKCVLHLIDSKKREEREEGPVDALKTLMKILGQLEEERSTTTKKQMGN